MTTFAGFAIPVKVPHSSDPEIVKSILLKAANEHPSVLTLPAPSYDFEDFGMDNLSFKLYAYVDLRAGGNVTADLRISILKAFRETGIANPPRQAEVAPAAIDLLRETAGYLSGGAQKTKVDTKKSALGSVATLPKKAPTLVGS